MRHYELPYKPLTDEKSIPKDMLLQISLACNQAYYTSQNDFNARGHGDSTEATEETAKEYAKIQNFYELFRMFGRLSEPLSPEVTWEGILRDARSK